jgi:hypothetical protein
MSKEKKWEERIDDLLGEFGLTRAEALKGHLKFDDKVGEINILDEVKPRMITVKNVDDAKRFAGVPDEDYNEELSKYFDILPPCPGEYNKLAPGDLEPRHKQDIKRAMISYIYGNSQKVKSYKDIINKVHFPMKVPLLTGGDLTVYTGQIMNCQANIVYETITVYQGGQLNCTDSINIQAKNLVQSPDVKYPPQAARSFAEEDIPPTGTTESVGSPGIEGSVGGNGSAGGKGSQGGRGTDLKDRCDSPDGKSGKGGTGGNGTDGTAGGAGGNGGNSNPVTAHVYEIQGNIVLGSCGGNGGKGGKGGNGGNGGEGGNGGPNTPFCHTGDVGQGGNGGKAGDGGCGGRGGDGNVLIFTFNTKAQGANITLGPTNSLGGGGGSPGTPGDGGNGNPWGNGGAAGNVGATGTNGKVGNVTWNELGPQGG